MAIMNIVAYPDLVLRMKAKPITNIDGDLQVLIDNMLETMYLAPGVGLAAPQVGISSRLIVGDPRKDNTQQDQFVLINPEIVDYRGEDVYEEGCLSLPGISADIVRALEVTVTGLNRDGQEVVMEAEGFLARILQHEIDHIEGILFWDRLSKAKKESLKRKFKKLSIVEESA